MKGLDAYLTGEIGGNPADPSSPAYDGRWEDRADAIDALVDRWMDNPAMVAKADEWNDGAFDPEHYTEVERALADLGAVPADKLAGSDALTRVLRLAEIHQDARLARLTEMAEAEVDRREAA